MSELKYIRDGSTGFMPALLIPAFKSQREEVRWKVRHLNLSALDRETRQAAAADPSIIWDAVERQYRFLRKSDATVCVGNGQYLDQSDPRAFAPAPPLANDGHVLPLTHREGGIESFRSPAFQTGDGQ